MSEGPRRAAQSAEGPGSGKGARRSPGCAARCEDRKERERGSSTRDASQAVKNRALLGDDMHMEEVERRDCRPLSRWSDSCFHPGARSQGPGLPVCELLLEAPTFCLDGFQSNCNFLPTRFVYLLLKWFQGTLQFRYYYRWCLYFIFFSFNVP